MKCLKYRIRNPIIRSLSDNDINKQISLDVTHKTAIKLSLEVSLSVYSIISTEIYDSIYEQK